MNSNENYVMESETYPITVSNDLQRGNGSLRKDAFLNKPSDEAITRLYKQKTFINPDTYMIPKTTQVSRVCFNEELNNAGPFYLRHWPTQLPDVQKKIDNNMDNDPRYYMKTTNLFSSEYKKLK